MEFSLAAGVCVTLQSQLTLFKKGLEDHDFDVLLSY